ncbi:glycosyltransferase family A protein [Mucilaginibacter sabulilitoris]|uniref:Glycosyltransferase family A protein n=1 Tax=Mucilaginibacter sabulilitoris TaxID=1173583 RepID=A0ABZ0THC9_9SPHI|nr:glycosyltransferase family A protein [Mucilaginibacter sabulilitoris]WPU91638.1 glycosyltransferase family A protein [Mucilaginibacter sabulilitoris]
MDKALVSIIMPAYNAEQFIFESIESVIRQTYAYWELIVVDDGSTDHTAGIIQQFAAIDARIIYLYQENAKQGKARNHGISKSRGDYVAFLDADDKWEKSKLSMQMGILSAHHQLDLIFSQGYFLQDSDVRNFDVNVQETWDCNSVKDFLYHNQIPILSVIVKRSALLKVGGFTEQPAIQNIEDYHLWIKLLLAGSIFRSVAHRLFYYRIHPQQSTFGNTDSRLLFFNLYEDIYYYYADDRQKPIFMDKIRWFIFHTEYYSRCLLVYSFYLNKKRWRVIAVAMEKLFNRPSALNQKILFKLLSWGSSQ